MRRRVVVGVGAIGVLILALGAWAVWPRGTTEVSEQDALDDFRDREPGPSTKADEDAVATSVVPEPGVYRFRATGEEEVKLGPLPAETRPFPEAVTAVVVDRGDGCFEITVNLFAEHTEDTRYCTDDGALTLDAHTKHQQIGALSPTATMTCDPATVVAPDQEEHDLACTLELSGGPAAISASLTGTAVRGEPEERTVGPETVEATPVTVSYEVTGDLAGTWTETLWLTGTNMPVRIERTLDLTGPATFSERSELDLESLTPAT